MSPFSLAHLLRSSGKKRLVFFLLIAGSMAILTLLWSGAAIRLAARGKTYNSVQSIPHRRVGLVLGCCPYLNVRRPNPFYQNRIAAAVALYEAKKVDFLLLSGNGAVKDESETRAMQQSLLYAGIPVDRIYLDDAGYRTLDSLVRAKEVFGQTEITLISQEFHNQRALFLAKHIGLDAIGFNADTVDWMYNIQTQCREQLARVKAVLEVFVFGILPQRLESPVIIHENRSPIP